MSCNKRQQQRDDCDEQACKRHCYDDEESSSSENESLEQAQWRIPRPFTDEERTRVLSILEKEFDKELQAKEKEVIEIQERIQKTQMILQYLCYAVVSDFYSREKTITSVVSTRERRIHPAVKKLLSGKAPRFPHQQQHTAASESCSLTISHNQDTACKLPESQQSIEKEKKVPRYIPPKPKKGPDRTASSEPVRGGQNKVKTILLVGNVSKWLPLDSRDDAATHKWMVYVRGPKEAPSVSGFVSKVRFFLHPSYRPNDVVQVVCPPFQLSRRGWGEFPIRVQVHFSSPLNKPVDIIHNLKLDRTYSGLQTLGSETVAEVWIHREDPQVEILCQKSGPPILEISRASESDYGSLSEQTVIKEEPASPLSPHLSTAETFTSSTLCKSEPIDNEDASSDVVDSIEGDGESGMSDVIIKREPPWNASSFPSSAVTSDESKSSKEVPSVDCIPSIQNQEQTDSVESPTTGSATAGSSNAVGPAIVSPSAHVVKCVDRSGVVRFVKMSPDMLTKLLNSNSSNGRHSISDSSSESERARNTPEGTSLPVLQMNPALAVPVKIASMQPNSISPPKVQHVLPRQAAPAIRPILRLVRPSGDVRARPWLISTNRGTSSVAARSASSVNGNRPVLVMKDGKFYVMNNPLSSPVNCPSSSANASGLSTSVTNTITSVQSRSLQSNSCNLIDSAITQAASNPDCFAESKPTRDACKPTSVISPEVSHLKNITANASTSRTRPSIAEASVNVSVPQREIKMKNVANVNPTSSRSVAITAAVQSPNVMSSPRPSLLITPQSIVSSDVSKPTKIGTSTPAPGKVNSIISRSTVKPGMSLLKSGVSILKSNVGLQSPSGPNPPSPAPSSSPAPTPATKRVILGRACGSSTIATSSHRSQLYRDQLSRAVRLCPRPVTCEEGIWRAVRWMVRRLPLVHADARHIEFKVLFPYCAPNESTFCSWNIGKQRACEWLRARSVRQSLIEIGWELESMWTTREIVLWARFHGYMPGLTIDDGNDPEASCHSSDSGSNSREKEDLFAVCDYSEPAAAEKWLAAQESVSAGVALTDQSGTCIDALDESDEEVDVVSCDSSPSKVIVKQEQLDNVPEKLRYDMPLEPSLHVLSQMVSETLNRCGLNKLASEEISPGVFYPAAQRMLLQVVQSLAEDLSRRAFADAWGDNVAKQPSSIAMKNVCGAILHRPELDLLTCSGLGVLALDSSVMKDPK